MLNTIVENTNTVIETFLAGKQDMIDHSDKYSFYKKVDLIDIKAFLGLLYLRAQLKLNMFDRETINMKRQTTFLKQQCHSIASFLYRDS